MAKKEKLNEEAALNNNLDPNTLKMNKEIKEKRNVRNRNSNRGR